MAKRVTNQRNHRNQSVELFCIHTLFIFGTARYDTSHVISNVLMLHLIFFIVCFLLNSTTSGIISRIPLNHESTTNNYSLSACWLFKLVAYLVAYLNLCKLKHTALLLAFLLLTGCLNSLFLCIYEFSFYTASLLFFFEIFESSRRMMN